MKKRFFVLILCLLGLLQLSAQKVVSGTIADDQGVPLPGASVVVKGTTTGVQSDFDGNYSISVTEGEVLAFSYIGYRPQEIVVGSTSRIDVTLATDTSQLDEVVVIGYGTQKVVNLTGSVETVRAEEITRQPVPQTSQALAGLVPGLTAVQDSGQPGDDTAVLRIRGIGTLGDSRKNNPLVLIDGVPDNINGLDPSDIESISVLKDASAAAIYGSRAANGVILVTTKRGKEGKLSVSLNSYTGIQSIAQNLKFLDALGFIEAFSTAEPNAFPQETIDAYQSGVGRGTEALPDTDWVGLLFKTAAVQQYHSLAIRGGTEKLKASATISFTDQDGNVPNFNFKRYTGRFNLDYNLSKKLDIAFDMNFRRDVRKQPGPLDRIVRQVYRFSPLFTGINDDGTFGTAAGGGNPLALANSTALDERIINYFRILGKVTYRPFNNFSISATYAPQFSDIDRDDFRARYELFDFSGALPILTTGGADPSSLLKTTSTSFQDNFTALANWGKDFNDHNISALFGYEFFKNTSESFQARRVGFVLDEFRTLNNGLPDQQTNNGTATQSGLESVFGRINYAFKDKYLLEANVRRDASSRFAPGFRSQTFPSFSVGWVVTGENFLKDNPTLNFLKFKGSWGELGNQFIFGPGGAQNFVFVTNFGLGNANAVLGDEPVIGGAQTQLSNPELIWETGVTQNIGVDARMFDSRLSLTAEAYIRKTEDILLPFTVVPSVGLGRPQENVGSVQNTGYDFSFGWTDRIGEHFRYGFNANYSTFENEITDLGGEDELPPGETINRLGEEIGAIFGLKTDGLYQESDFDVDGNLNSDLPQPQFGAIQAGDIKYVDFNNDGVINNDDRTIIGSAINNRNWGLDLFAEYKNVDLSISFLGAGGGNVVLQGDIGYPFFNGGKIQEWQTDFWTPTNTDARYPRVQPASSHPNWRTNEVWQFDRTYTRLRNVTFGYSLPRRLLDNVNMSQARVYVSGQNLITWDKMPDGIDPLTPNFSRGSIYPIAKVVTVGFNVTF